jgi:hypothetical protein
MSETFKINGGRMLMQRIGPINPQRQRNLIWNEAATPNRLRGRNPRSPERRGIWAFPWPLYDRYFSSYQIALVTPKHLQLVGKKLNISLEEIEADELAQKEWWNRKSTRQRLRVRSFWVSGSVYTHLGRSSSDSEWVEMSVKEFSTELRRQYAKDLALRKGRGQSCAPLSEQALAPGYNHRRSDLRGPWPASVDHLEVFLGRGAKIH